MSNVLRFPSNGRRSERAGDRNRDLERDPDLDRDADDPDDAGGERPGPRLRDVVGGVLRDERLDQDRTLADVAREAAVSLPYLSEVERGIKDVSSDVLGAICDALDLPLADVLQRSADRLRIDARAQGGTRLQLAAA
ncbi:MAG: helix-turn-helix transcriptional regulator [Ilumatobacter sp.]|uniref:helix-turn-helix domain-containing protein n=1 Tax=Ilumatobacter sp. TaxID=1967498 RepID=UPI0032990B78